MINKASCAACADGLLVAPPGACYTAFNTLNLNDLSTG